MVRKLSGRVDGVNGVNDGLTVPFDHADDVGHRRKQRPMSKSCVIKGGTGLLSQLQKTTCGEEIDL
jgi:hypothetical protein